VSWLPRALAASLAVHVAVGAVALAWPSCRNEVEAAEIDTGDRRADDAIEVTPPSPPPPAVVPIELVTVAMIAPPDRAPPPAPPQLPPPPRPEMASDGKPAAPSRAPAIATTAPASSGDPAATAATRTTAPAGPETSTGSRLLSMRDPIRRPDGAAAGATLARIADAAAPPPEIPHSGRLAQHGQKTRIDDLTFTATIDDDGTAHIVSKGDASFSVHLPRPSDIKRKLASWVEDPYAYTRRLTPPQDDIESAPRGDRAHLTPKDDKPDVSAVVPVIGGNLDITSWISRKILGEVKGDVYAARKRLALEQTFDERAEMRRRHRKDQLDHADLIVRDSLDRLWASALPLADKKQALFELWDDCAETGDAAVVDAAARARSAIVGFIRAHLPAGSPDAFTSDELAALDAHRGSRAHFAPYDDAAP
jgi:hypothetical protein